MGKLFGKRVERISEALLLCARDAAAAVKVTANLTNVHNVQLFAQSATVRECLEGAI